MGKGHRSGWKKAINKRPSHKPPALRPNAEKQSDTTSADTTNIPMAPPNSESRRRSGADQHSREGSFHKLWAHWVISIIVGTGVTYSGPDEVLIRSVFLAVMLVVIVVDTWMVALKQRPRNYTFASIASVVLVLIFAGLGFWTHRVDLTNRLAEARDGLTFSVQAASDPWDSIFTITNNSGQVIGAHRTFCSIVGLRTKNNVTLGNSLVQGPQTASPLEPGTSDSWTCLESVGGKLPLVCADIVVRVDYKFPVGSTAERIKRDRFVALWDGQRFLWGKQQVNDPTSYCSPGFTDDPWATHR